MDAGLDEPARLVMAFDRARAEETPFPPPDMSSPSSSFANLSFIISMSAVLGRSEPKALEVSGRWVFT